MAERKGLFGRLFGKKDKSPDADLEPATTEDDVSSLTPDPVEPRIEERTEAEEMEDLDAAHSTAPSDGEAVVLVPHQDNDSSSPTETLDPEDDIPEAIIESTSATEEVFSDPPQLHDEPVADSEEPAPVDDSTEAPEPPEPALEDTVAADNTDPQPEPEAEPKKRGLFGRLKDGLAKTSAKLSSGIGSIFTKRKLDDETLEELEDLLITADLGLPATTRIITTLSKTKYDQEITDEEVRSILAAEVAQTLQPLEAPLDIRPDHHPHVILMTGVNGAGKTTTIGKLARKYTDEGHKVLLAAGDTFRAAAVEQLKVWGERVGVPVVAKETGADAAGLAYDAIKQAQDEAIDVVLIDTAGRLQNRKELMEELGKIVRVIKKLAPDAPHDTVLVLDATVGQNAISQAESFIQTAAVSGLVMTKLDGTARGGVLVALGDKFALPIHFIGVGEAVEDLQPFRADDFAQALTAPGD